MSDITTLVTTAVGVGSFVIAAATFHFNRRNGQHEQAWRTSEDTFLRVRKRVKSGMSELQRRARVEQAEHLLDDQIPLLVAPHWLPSAPLPLSQVILSWRRPDSEEHESQVVTAACKQTQRYWPRSNELVDRYHDVIERLERPNPALFFDGSSYRLLGVEPTVEEDGCTSKVEMTFTQGWYFDALDTTDVLSYESAFRELRRADRIPGFTRSKPLQGRYRRWLGSPFALERRCAIPGVSTLTIRRGAPVPTFILHRRDAAKVALAQGVTHVIPAGEFQPANLSASASDGDLNLWKNIVREYAEEVLGIEPARGQALGQRQGELLEHATSALTNAERSGAIDVHYLGIGFDPLTWKPEILSVAIFAPEVFDEVFQNIVRENDEGTLVFADEGNMAGIPFTEFNIEHHARGKMLTAGQACLRLAWRHRVVLGLTENGGRRPASFE